jgi:hypothetical protein
MPTQLYQVHLDPQPDVRPDELMLLLMVVEPGKRRLMSAQELAKIAEPLRRHLYIAPDLYGPSGSLPRMKPLPSD